MSRSIIPEIMSAKRSVKYKRFLGEEIEAPIKGATNSAAAIFTESPDNILSQDLVKTTFIMIKL